MSTLRISNIEAKSVPASATVDEKVKITNSSGDTLVFIDGKTSGITTVGINTTDSNITFDANSNVVVTGIITATKFSGQFEPTSVGIADSIFHTGDTDTSINFPAADTITAETGGSERLRITSTGQLLLMSNTGYNPSSSLLSLATDASAAANMLSDSSSIYNHNNPAFVHVQNMNNTGDGQEAGIILHSKSSFGGAWAIYGKRTTSGFKSDLIFRGRTGSSSSAERVRIDSNGRKIQNYDALPSVSSNLTYSYFAPTKQNYGGVDLTMNLHDDASNALGNGGGIGFSANGSTGSPVVRGAIR